VLPDAKRLPRGSPQSASVCACGARGAWDLGLCNDVCRSVRIGAARQASRERGEGESRKKESGAGKVAFEGPVPFPEEQNAPVARARGAIGGERTRGGRVCHELSRARLGDGLLRRRKERKIFGRRGAAVDRANAARRGNKAGHAADLASLYTAESVVRCWGPSKRHFKTGASDNSFRRCSPARFGDPPCEGTQRKGVAGHTRKAVLEGDSLSGFGNRGYLKTTLKHGESESSGRIAHRRKRPRGRGRNAFKVDPKKAWSRCGNNNVRAPSERSGAERDVFDKELYTAWSPRNTRKKSRTVSSGSYFGWPKRAPFPWVDFGGPPPSLGKNLGVGRSPSRSISSSCGRGSKRGRGSSERSTQLSQGDVPP